MSDLTEFLLARITEGEEMARSAVALGGNFYDDKPVKWHWLSTNGESTSWQPTPVDPARALAECEAKRRIVELHGANDNDYGAECAARIVAAVYADHPDYRDEWKP